MWLIFVQSYYVSYCVFTLQLAFSAQLSKMSAGATIPSTLAIVV